MKRAVAAFTLFAAAAAAQDFANLKVERIAAGYRFTEGPVWSKEGFLLFSDVPNNLILQWIPGNKALEFRKESNGANGNTFDQQGRLYTCESITRRVTRTNSDGKIEVLADKWEGKRLNAPNDIVVSRNNHIYFTDPAFGAQADSRDLDFYGVYHIPPKGPMKLIAKPAGRPNGIALSSNGRILYVANTDDRNVRAYDLDRNGEASNERVFVSGVDGPPDGIKTDEKGNLYVTANGVAVYNAGGKLLHAIPLSDPPSNCAWGDPDFKALYVTARGSVYRIRLEVRGTVPYAGRE
jgi:sugar lactone lactonase YvrE